MYIVCVRLHASKLYPHPTHMSEGDLREKWTKSQTCDVKRNVERQVIHIDLSGKSWKDAQNVWIEVVICVETWFGWMLLSRNLWHRSDWRRRWRWWHCLDCGDDFYHKFLILIHVWMYNRMMNKNDFHMWVNWIENENLLDGWPNLKYEWIAWDTRCAE